MLKPARVNKEDHRADHLSAEENSGQRSWKKHEKEIHAIAHLYGKPYMKEERLTFFE